MYVPLYGRSTKVWKLAFGRDRQWINHPSDDKRQNKQKHRDCLMDSRLTNEKQSRPLHSGRAHNPSTELTYLLFHLSRFTCCYLIERSYFQIHTFDTQTNARTNPFGAAGGYKSTNKLECLTERGDLQQKRTNIVNSSFGSTNKW